MPPRLSAFLKRQRLLAVRPYIRGDVLDLGCSAGATQDLLSPGQTYVGVDLNDRLVNRARALYPAREFHVRDLERQELALEGTFDTVLMIAVIEHLESPDNLLRQLAKYLKPQGRLLITTPTPLGHVVHNLGAQLGLFYKEAAQDHKQKYNLPSLRARLEAHGFGIIVQETFLFGGNQLAVCKAD